MPFGEGRAAKKARRAAQTAAGRAAQRAGNGDDDDEGEQPPAGGPAAGAVEPALPPAGGGVPLQIPIEEHGPPVGPGPIVDESMTQRADEGDETMEQTVDEGVHGTGAALGAPVDPDDSEEDSFLLQAAEEEEEEEVAAAAEAAAQAQFRMQMGDQVRQLKCRRDRVLPTLGDVTQRKPLGLVDAAGDTASIPERSTTQLRSASTSH